MTGRGWTTGLVVAVAVVLVAAAVIPRLEAQEPIKFGFSAPLTSPIAFIAERAKLGTEYAVAQLNARGGILGRRVEVLYGDTRLDPNEAINIARRYTLQEKVSAYFGEIGRAHV